MKSVAVSRGGFRFCRWAVAIVLWLALLLRSAELLLAATAILALNALVGVGRAPLILAWDHTVGRLFPSAEESLVESSMRFAHILGALAGACALALILGKTPELGWTLLLWFAAFKTAGAMGFCLISRLYTVAVQRGDCCRFLCGRLKKPAGDDRAPLER
jgi:hypothetical protein